MTKQLLLAVAAALSLGAAAPAIAHPGENHAGESQAAVPQSAEGQGVVRAINARQGTITVQHEPIAALGWPAMTMAFRVTSADLLTGLSVGARVRFVLVNDNGRPVVSEIRVLS